MRLQKKLLKLKKTLLHKLQKQPALSLSMKTVVLVGNFGVGNFGDEAIVEFYLQRFPNVCWKVISHTPKENQLYRLPLGVRSFFTPWLRTVIAMYRADCVVVGGGTLFTDSESVTACILWWLHVVVPKMMGKSIHFAFQGIGPCNTLLGAMLTKSALRSATTISVRDSRSYAYVQELGYTNVFQTFDPVILLLPESYTYSYTHSCLVVIPRHNSNDAFLQLVKDAARKDWDEVLILSFHPNNPEEVILTNQLQTLFVSSTIRSITSIEEAVEYIGSASMVLSQRFHGTLIAKALGKHVESTGIVAQDKHTALHVAMNDLEKCRTLASAGFETLQNALR
jgi:polysaccharide pyruvyl transferase WcaK-like protein